MSRLRLARVQLETFPRLVTRDCMRKTQQTRNQERKTKHRMNTNISKKITIQSMPARMNWFSLAAAFFAFACAAAPANDRFNHRRPAIDRYRQINLVSDLPGAAVQDTNLVNAWGISFSPTGPFWVSATETGRAVVYSVTNDASGSNIVTKLPLEVTIPGEGNVTGQVFNDTSGFNSNRFLFVSEDGTISGWRPALGTGAETLTTRTGAVYKGVAILPTLFGPVLLVANFSEGTIDAYDSDLTLLRQFSDRRAPAGYAPFNVQVVAGHVFVTFAKQDDEKEDDVAGPGHGLIDVLNPFTGRFRRFATGSDAGGRLREINSPWGIALVPRSFGRHNDRLLVGNFGSGTIMVFEVDGDFRGLLEDADDNPIVIEGLWALTFGNGVSAGDSDTLYFTAGPGDETHGLFGSLEPVRKLNRDRNDDGDDDDDKDDDDSGKQK
jgi:uncharacterized protein (TIGR03118 family)